MADDKKLNELVSRLVDTFNGLTEKKLHSPLKGVAEKKLEAKVKKFSKEMVKNY